MEYVTLLYVHSMQYDNKTLSQQELGIGGETQTHIFLLQIAHRSAYGCIQLNITFDRTSGVDKRRRRFKVERSYTATYGRSPRSATATYFRVGDTAMLVMPSVFSAPPASTRLVRGVAANARSVRQIPWALKVYFVALLYDHRDRD